MIKKVQIAFFILLLIISIEGRSDNGDSLLIVLTKNIEFHKLQGNYQDTYMFNYQLIQLKDSLTKIDRANLLAEMQESYNLENKVKQLELLNAQNIANEESLRIKKQQQILFIGSAFLLLFLTIGLRNRIIIVRKTRDLIKLSNKTLQEERMNATKSQKFKNQFLANVSHEIRTPMNAIMGITNILIKNKHLEEQKKFLEAMHQSSKNLLLLINDILDLSKLEAGKVEIKKSTFRISDIITEIDSKLKGKAKEKGIGFNVVIDPDVPEIIYGDSRMLYNILFPIINNGITFTNKGSVTVICNIANHVENNYIIRFTIRDTGIGIIKEKVDKILNTFVKVHDKDILNYDGSGLELPIIKQMLNLQGGDIKVDSESGKGTTFYIEIPYAPGIEILNDELAGDSVFLNVPDKLSILLVEDNEFNVLVATEEINSAFKQVDLDVVENGKLALEKVISNDYHIILMDVQMPIMNGYEATIQIRKLNGQKSKIPIIAMTANVIQEEIDKCFKSGMDAYLSKPFETSELVNRINSLVAEKN